MGCSTSHFLEARVRQVLDEDPKEPATRGLLVQVPDNLQQVTYSYDTVAADRSARQSTEVDRNCPLVAVNE